MDSVDYHLQGKTAIRAYQRQDAPEHPIYVAMKLHMHERRHNGQNALPHISPRWLQALLRACSKDDNGIAELHGVTSQFLRERLRSLNHGTALQQLPAGPNKALLYAWNEPMNPGAVHSYAQLRNLMKGRCLLALDVSRLLSKFGADPFDAKSFVEVYRNARQHLLERPWYALRGGEQVLAPEFTQFLMKRRKLLLEVGCLELSGSQTRVSPKGELCGYWFDLLVHCVDYPVSRDGRVARSPARRAVPR